MGLCGRGLSNARASLGLALRLVPIFDAPVPFNMWSAPWRAQAQIAAAWVSGSVALTAIGWLFIAVYLPVATGADRYDVTVLWNAHAVIPGIGGLLLGIVAHARLTIVFIDLGARCGLTAAYDYLAKTFATASPGTV